MLIKKIELYGMFYNVQADGKIFSYATGKELKQRLNQDGYLEVTVGKSSRRTTMRTHRIVAEAFVPNPNNYTEVDHLDCNRVNANASNLEWVTHKENIIRSHERGNCNRKGTKNGRARLDEEQVLTIREYFKNGMTQGDLAKKYDCGWSTVHNIVHYYTWAHI